MSTEWSEPPLDASLGEDFEEYEEPPTDWSDPAFWVDALPQGDSLPSLSSPDGFSHAVDLVRALGLYHPFVSYEATALAPPLVLVRVLEAGRALPAAGSDAYIVTPDDRVYVSKALPWTYLDTAEEVLSAIYAEGRDLDPDEAARVQTEIEVLALRRASG